MTTLRVPTSLKTVPRREYRFIGAVNGGPGNGAERTALAEAKPDAVDKPARHLRSGTAPRVASPVLRMSSDEFHGSHDV
jgi:hypothetical protein